MHIQMFDIYVTLKYLIYITAQMARAVKRKSGPRSRDMMQAPSVPKLNFLKKKRSLTSRRRKQCAKKKFFTGDMVLSTILLEF